ncbi:transglycosylase domain-containing protein [soil metagenome]
MSRTPGSIQSIKSKINDILNIRRSWFSVLIKYCWIFFFVFVFGLPLYVFSVGINLFGLFGEMPSLTEIENPENDLSSELISADGVSLGRYFRYENRSQVNYKDLSPVLVKTLLISEDHRFYQHSGLDLTAFGRVIKSFGRDGGGSTITQQTAKNLFTMNPDHSLDGSIAKLGALPRRIVQKTKEWIISVTLERNFTKEEIIALYLNTVEFSSNAYGIKVASETYFNKSPDQLDLRESALLVGMLQSITAFNPRWHPNAAVRKRNQVLTKVYRAKYKLTTQRQYDSITALDLGLRFQVQNQNQGIATYFRTVINPRLKEICAKYGIDLRSSGLRIYTTIDSRLQRYAEQTVAERMKGLQKEFYTQWAGANPWRDEDRKEIEGFLDSRIRQADIYKSLVNKYGEKSDSIMIVLNLKKRMSIFTWDGERDTLFSSMDSLAYYKRFLQAGLVSMDPRTGHVKAWVGGLNHKYFKFDHVLQAKRQPGSTFKPFIYGFAVESNYNPCMVREDISPSFAMPGGKIWYPPNHDGKLGSGEKMTLRHAMAESVNTITAQLMKALGPENIIEFAHRVGIKSKLDTVPSLCLGVSDVSLYEMAGAYSTFVNSGIYTEPFYITRIEDKNGNVIESFTPKTRQAISPETANKIIYLLRGGVEEEGGSSRGLSEDVKSNNEIGGKTGTTNNASDGWYMGVTHDLVTGVWVGGDERSIHFKTWALGQGSRSARPVWEKYMLKAYNDRLTGITKGKFKVSGEEIEGCIGLDSVSLNGKSMDIK